MDQAEIKRIVAAGYDRLGHRYAAWAATVRVEERRKYADLFLQNVPEGEAVLELGCGPGGENTRAFAARYRLTGIDFSASQLALARRDCPQAEFIHADMLNYAYPPAHFGGVAAFYCLFHLPPEDLPLIFTKIHATLKNTGVFVGCLGVGGRAPEVESDWLGVEMVSASFDMATNERIVREAGFAIESSHVDYAAEFDRAVPFHWFVARKA